MDTLRHYWLQLNASLWFVPLLYGASGVGLAVLLLSARPEVGSGPVARLVYAGDSESARSLLGALLTGMITMTSLIVSITIVVLTLAAAQLGPRLIRNFTEDRATQQVLGLFIGTILYLLVVLRTVEGSGRDSVPSVAVTLGTIFSAICLFVLLFYVNRLAGSIVSDRIARRVAVGLHATMGRARRVDPDAAEDERAIAAAWADGDAADIAAGADGYLQSVELDALVAAAGRADALIRMPHAPGSWLIEGQLLAQVVPARARSPELEGQVRRAAVLGPSRSPTHDVEFDLQRLVELAARALSPGVDDTFTAIAAIDNLGSSLARLFACPLERRALYDEEQVLRVVRDVPDYPRLVATAFDHVRHVARNSPVVACHLVETIGRLAASVTDLAQQRALLEQVEAVHAPCGEWSDRDRDALARRHRTTVAALRAAGSRTGPGNVDAVHGRHRDA